MKNLAVFLGAIIGLSIGYGLWCGVIYLVSLFTPIEFNPVIPLICCLLTYFFNTAVKKHLKEN